MLYWTRILCLLYTVYWTKTCLRFCRYCWWVFHKEFWFIFIPYKLLVQASGQKKISLIPLKDKMKHEVTHGKGFSHIVSLAACFKMAWRYVPYSSSVRSLQVPCSLNIVFLTPIHNSFNTSGLPEESPSTGSVASLSWSLNSSKEETIKKFLWESYHLMFFS